MFTVLTPGAVTCTSSQPTQCSCVFQNNTLIVSNCFPLNASTSFTLTLPNISNPIYAKTSTSFQVYIYSSSKGLLDSLTTGTTIQFKSYTLSYASIIPSGNAGNYSI